MRIKHNIGFLLRKHNREQQQARNANANVLKTSVMSVKQAIYCFSVKLKTKEQRNRQIMLIDHFGQVTTRNCRYLASVRIFQYYFDRDT